MVLWQKKKNLKEESPCGVELGGHLNILCKNENIFTKVAFCTSHLHLPVIEMYKQPVLMLSQNEYIVHTV